MWCVLQSCLPPYSLSWDWKNVQHPQCMSEIIVLTTLTHRWPITSLDVWCFHRVSESSYWTMVISVLNRNNWDYLLLPLVSSLLCRFLQCIASLSGLAAFDCIFSQGSPHLYSSKSFKDLKWWIMSHWIIITRPLAAAASLSLRQKKRKKRSGKT